MKLLAISSLFFILFLNGAFFAADFYQKAAHGHQDWCQNWCLRLKPLWLEMSRTIASFAASSFAAAFLFFSLAAPAARWRRPLCFLNNRPTVIPRDLPPDSDFFNPLSAALRRGRLRPLFFDSHHLSVLPN